MTDGGRYALTLTGAAILRRSYGINSPSMLKHIRLPVLDDTGARTIGQEVIEVEPIDSTSYRLLHSPAFVDGIAAGDVIELVESLAGFRVCSRSGNVAVVIAFGSDEAKGAATQALAEGIALFGGTVDGGPGRMKVCTIPVASGFSQIERLFQALCSDDQATWWFGNVYGTDGEPLRWWEP